MLILRGFPPPKKKIGPSQIGRLAAQIFPSRQGWSQGVSRQYERLGMMEGCVAMRHVGLSPGSPNNVCLANKNPQEFRESLRERPKVFQFTITSGNKGIVCIAMLVYRSVVNDW